jgi:hypothetical protein
MKKYAGLALALLTATAPALAAPPTLDIDGVVFTVTTDVDYYTPPVPYGYVTVTDSPNVGMWGHLSEWQVGRAEYMLEGLDAVTNATFSFTLDARYGFSDLDYIFNSSALLRVDTYVADGKPVVYDYAPASGLSYVGSFEFGTSPLGTVVTFDVTEALSAAIARGDKAFGMGLTQMVYADKFARLSGLTLTVTPVPEPSTYAMLLGGLALIGVMRKRRR